MKKFDIDYDEDNDDLFVYLPDVKSSGSVEVGNFVFDLDSVGNLVGIEIFDASEFFKTIFSKIIEMSKIKEFRADVINFRNTTSILRFSVTTDSGTEQNKIIIPRVFKSPSISY